MGENIAPIDDVREPTPKEKIAARLYTCDNALDKDDAILLLDMLGLIEPVHKPVTQDEFRKSKMRDRNTRRRKKNDNEREV